MPNYMSFGAHNLSPAVGSRKRTKRVGRGNASQKGTTAGRGMKGQRSRSGGKSGTAVRGLRQSLLKIPKKRGFTSLAPKAQTVTLIDLSRATKDNDVIDPFVLEARGVIRSGDKPVKIVSTGELSTKIVVSGCKASATAKKAIVDAGGSFTE